MNAFEWLRDQIGGETLNDERFEQRERSYYQYDSLEDIELNIREGNVFCGFCIPNQNGRVYIAYGNFSSIHEGKHCVASPYLPSKSCMRTALVHRGAVRALPCIEV